MEARLMRLSLLQLAGFLLVGGPRLGWSPQPETEAALLVEAAAAAAQQDRQQSGSNKNLICYYDGPGAASRPAAGSLALDQLDASLCTHIIYRYIRFGEDNQLLATMPQLELDSELGAGAGSFSKLAALKQLNPSLKTLVSVTEDSGLFSRMAGSSESRASFVASALEFIEAHSMNGLELVWKYPNDWSGGPADKQNLVRLVEELEASLAPRGHLVAVAAPVGDRRVRAGFEVAQLAAHAQLINLMSLDYNGAWDNETGLHAPLYQAAEGEAALSVDWSVKLWLSLGAPAHKLQVAVSAYVRTFNLLDKNQNGLRKPTRGLAKPGPYIGDPKLWGYGEWCELYQRSPPGQWRVVRDVAGSGGSYAHSGSLWVSLEDRDSASLKGRYVARMGLGGALVHSLDMDDFAGRCHEGLRFPIAVALKEGLLSSSSSSTDRKPVPVHTGEPANRNTLAPDEDDEAGSSIEEGEYPRRPTTAPKPPAIRPPPASTQEPLVVYKPPPPSTRPPAPAPRPAPVAPPPAPAPPLAPVAPPVRQEELPAAGKLPTCGANGNWYFSGPTCRQYYDCTDTGAPVLKLCRDNLVWKQSKLWCDFQENVPECLAS